MTLRDAGGAAVADQEVVVAQRRHRFRFGGTDFDLIGLANGELSGDALVVAERSAAAFLDLFNSATLPFYWGGFEPVRGQPDTGADPRGGALVRRPRRHRQGPPAGLAHA